MEQLEALWQYMQADLKADRIANEMKHSPARQKAEKARDVFTEQQKLAKALTEQVASHTDRMDAVKDAIKRCAEQLAALNEKISTAMPQDPEELRALISDVERHRKTIADYEQEMARLQKQGREAGSRASGILSTAAQAKQDFEKYKKEFQSETDKDSSGKKEQVEKLRAEAAGYVDQVPKAMMDEYLAIKRHTLPPMARLVNGACTGCNTSQPSALLAKINAGHDIVECETCGRILIRQA